MKTFRFWMQFFTLRSMAVNGEDYQSDSVGGIRFILAWTDGPKQSLRSHLRGSTTREYHPNTSWSGITRQHNCEGAPRWHWCAKKNGPQAIGKSRGGWTTKIHMVAAGPRVAVNFLLTPGNVHDATPGRELLMGPQIYRPASLLWIGHMRGKKLGS